jgi:cell wall-associated NlpC family hydrolase
MNFSKYIGLSYKHKGRTFEAVDCFGLIWLVMKEEFGWDLPDFTNINYSKDWYKKKENHILNVVGTLNKEQFSVIEPPYKRFDFILFFLGTKTVVNHCGLYIGDNKILHIYEGITSIVGRLYYPPLTKIYCAIRYKE